MTQAAPLASVIDALPSIAEFAAADAGQWRKAAAAALKGAPFERLQSLTLDGLLIEPLYTPSAASLRAIRNKPGAWRIAQRIDHPDPSTAQAQAMVDLEGGADALSLVFHAAAGAYGFGLRASDPDLETALAGVELDLIQLRLDPAGDGLATAQLTAALVARRGYAPSTLDIDFGCDACGEARDDLAALAIRLHRDGHAGRLFMADGRRLHAAGASEAQELAGALAAGVEALRLMERHGVAPELARGMIAFLLAADQDQFLGIAKFRAMRLLWARIDEGCGLEPEPIRLHGETAWRMMSRMDPYVNVLRASMGVFAAAIGGADVICALPFSQAIGLPDPFARRIARNSQLVLLEEAHLAKVSDPAAGAGGIEALTLGLCEKAWELFQSIERAGGLAVASQGEFGARIAATALARREALAAHTIAMTGVTEFVAATQPEIAVLAPLLAPVPLRLAEPYESPNPRDQG